MNNLPLENFSATEFKGNAPLPNPDELPVNNITNWSGNITYSTAKVYFPQTLAEVQALVKQQPKLKALGTRHCFNRIADSQDYFLSTRELNQVVALDTDSHTVTVAAGIKYGELAPFLHGRGYALPNLASLPHISVAGSIITATHGSGVGNGNLATSVVGLEMVMADGRVENFSKAKDDDIFNGVVVSLGAVGIITKVTLALEPDFKLRQNVFLNLPLAHLNNHFDQIVAAGYSVSLFSHWLNDNIDQVWIKSRGEENGLTIFNQEFFGARAAAHNMHPIAEMPAENCTEQMGVPGPWHERLPHFKMGFTPSSGVELQSEYFVPRRHAVEAIMALARLGKKIAPYLLISEIRTIAADDFWLSPCYRQDSVALHFTWKQDWPAVSKLLPLIEKELAPFQARPHWGKLFTYSPQVIFNLYERLPDFNNLVSRYDPFGKFSNEFLNKMIFNG